jgi:type IV pilus assembly protein PilO
MALTKEDLIKLPQLYKALILLGIMLVLAGIFYFLLYSPAQSELKTTTSQVKKLGQEVEKKRIIARDKPKYEKEVIELQAKLKLSIAQLPSDKEIPALLTSITEKGKSSGLEFTYFKQEKNVRKNYYSEIPATVKVAGDYHSVAKFFYRISKMDRIVQFSNLKMTGTKRKDAKGTLQASFRATTYKYEPTKPPTSGKKGKKKKKKRK